MFAFDFTEEYWKDKFLCSSFCAKFMQMWFFRNSFVTSQYKGHLNRDKMKLKILISTISFDVIFSLKCISLSMNWKFWVLWTISLLQQYTNNDVATASPSGGLTVNNKCSDCISLLHLRSFCEKYLWTKCRWTKLFQHCQLPVCFWCL